MQSFIKRGERYRVDLFISLLLFSIGGVLTFIVFIGPKTTDFKNGFYTDSASSNFAAIRAYRELENGEHEKIKNVIYNVNLIPDMNSNDIKITISTSLKQSKSTVYKITWPGEIRQHYFNSIALETKPDTSTDLLGVIEERQSHRETELKVRSRKDDFHKYEDYFMFFWKDGKERINFSDRRLRLQLATLNEDDVVNLEFGITESIQLIDESPQATEILPNIGMGVIERKYLNTSKLIVSYTERGLKRLSDFLLIISGLFIGLGSSYFTNWLTGILNAYRESKY